MMKKYLIIANGLKDNTKECVQQLDAFLEAQGAESFVKWIAYDTDLSVDLADMDLSEYSAGIVIGGDGTLIRSARALKVRNLPLIGVNVGTIGFLCEIDTAHLESSMRGLLEGNYRIESRMLLEGRVEDTVDQALNDIAIYRGGNLCVISLELYVNGRHLTTYRGDGVVISTPTGSTGYSMSCGGPIVDPVSSMIVVTPIAPHTIQSSRSIVLDSSAEIEIRPVYRNLRETEEILVSYDGVVTVPLNDSVFIKKAPFPAQLIRLGETSFLDVLKQKL
ncbi:MAG: NAD(+) kinase [Lachnospiraceae bacterium]|jgi:NAD+ kinase|nr:NAD(+) kinase [Lachnospiraceae bacterium]